MVKYRTLFPIHLKKIICIGFLGMLLTCFAGNAYAIDQTFSYLSVFSGSQDLSASPGGLGSESNYFEWLKESHGDLEENRKVQPSVIGFDFYRASGVVASGFGLEIQRYKKSFNFSDGSGLTLEALGVLWNRKLFSKNSGNTLFCKLGNRNHSLW